MEKPRVLPNGYVSRIMVTNQINQEVLSFHNLFVTIKLDGSNYCDLQPLDSNFFEKFGINYVLK